MIANRPLIVFFALAYAISWLVFVPIVFWHAPIELIAVASFGPTLAALIAHRMEKGDAPAFRLAGTLVQTIVSSGVGVVLVVLGYVVLTGLALSDHPGSLNWSVLTSVGVYNYSTLLGGPLGEEPGWRGYALPRLEARLAPAPAAVVLGLLWTGWHLPLFLIPGWGSLPLWSYTLVLVGVSVIMTYATNLARFGIVTAVATHAAFNTATRFLGGLFAGTEPRSDRPFEVVFPLCGIGVALVLVAITRARLGYRSSIPATAADFQRPEESRA